MIALFLALAAPARAAVLPEARGLRDLGMDVDVAVGVVEHASLYGHASGGYLLGLGVVYEKAMPWWVRLQVEHTGTTDGLGYITYLSGTTRPRDVDSAAWAGTLAHLGVAYAWHVPRRGWTPYAGVAATVGYGGYNYLYGAAAQKLEPPASPLAPAPDHESRTWLFGGGVNGGLELQFTRWLATYGELSVTFLPFGTPSVSNNIPSRDVRSAADWVFLSQARFGVRVLL